jgi:peptidoglycan hydrolase-like amidase
VPELLSRRQVIASALGLLATSDLSSSYSFWILHLLKPSHLIVYPLGSSRLHCTSATRESIVEGPSSFRIDSSRTPVQISGPQGAPVFFLIEIPRLVRRSYLGTLHIQSQGSLLIPVVTMDLEIAVSSIVGAELPTAGTPLEALTAQAVIARSYLAASNRPRHTFAKFCDTTHCQFLRAPARPGSAVAQSVEDTSGLILCSHSRPIPTRYSAACGGHTDSKSVDDYQYESTSCEVCRRLGLRRRGHGLGLCQEGAIGLARDGWHWQKILAKYYPNTSVESISLQRLS